MQYKSEATAAFKAYQAQAERQHSSAGHRIKELRFDGGGEFRSSNFRAYLESIGIRVQQTSADTSEQNGVAERMNRTVVESARAMLMHWTPHLPSGLWAEAVATAVYLRNRCLTRALTGMTPHEAWFGTKPSYKHLRTFGCLAYAHLTRQAREAYHMLGKLQPEAIRCIFVGYSSVARAGYRLWDPVGQKLITTLHASFEEHQPGFTTSHSMTPFSPHAFEDVLPRIPFPKADEGQSSPATAPESDSKDDLPPLIPPPASIPAADSNAPAVQGPVVEPHHSSAHTESSTSPPAAAAAPMQIQAPAKLPRELRRLQDTLSSGSRDNAPSTVTVTTQQPQAIQGTISYASVARLGSMRQSSR